MTLQEALAEAKAFLQKAGVDGAIRDARILLAHAMHIDQSKLTLHLAEPLDDSEYERFHDLISLRSRRMPVAQIIGTREFFGLTLRVNAEVLDPRPETETLVELALTEPFLEILDIGTGSGAILLALLAMRKNAIGTGTDMSAGAVSTAIENALLAKLEDRSKFLVSNWFEHVSDRFDLIVSNPPYIALKEMNELQPEVRNYEPHIALTDGGDGLGAYRAIAAGVMEHLKPSGRLLLEIRPTQALSVTGFLNQSGLENISVHPDLDGRDRVISAYAPQ